MLMLSPGEKLGAVVGLSLTPKLVAIAVRSIRDDEPGPIQPSGLREAPGRITKTGALAFARMRTLCESIPSGWIFYGFAKDVPAIMRQFQHPQGFEVDLFTGEHAAAILATGITVTFRGIRAGRAERHRQLRRSARRGGRLALRAGGVPRARTCPRSGGATRRERA